MQGVGLVICKYDIISTGKTHRKRYLGNYGKNPSETVPRKLQCQFRYHPIKVAVKEDEYSVLEINHLEYL